MTQVVAAQIQMVFNEQLLSHLCTAAIRHLQASMQVLMLHVTTERLRNSQRGGSSGRRLQDMHWSPVHILIPYISPH